ncbi:zinc finger CCCH domain-containing protein 54-like [Vitis riparia]|uniref:zinc finger CCCH domain-containing protein 54-like n=1 Tax=Vitis riparia TaxID=96939 RepID=UPI00155B1949|nr:zinc finger CCCH domain-containing protein 54-like [Vitis riparia]
MWKHLNLSASFYDFSDYQLEELGLNPTPFQYLPDRTQHPIYSSDEFRMYGFKIKKCSKTRSHDWTECPFAHRGEKAKRRDPRKVNYAAISCPDFRNGAECPRGEACEFAHGVFEYWLHPAKYRTRACNAGTFCQRKVCFFAHTPEQLRAETKYKCHFTYRVRRSNGGEDKRSGSDADERSVFVASEAAAKSENPVDGYAEFLRALRALKIPHDDDKSFGYDTVSDPDWKFDWISDLVE